TAGMLRTSKRLAARGASSTFTFARAKAPPASSASRSSTGPRARQGPHQGAQKSTTTGSSAERSRTARSKSASPTSLTAALAMHFTVPECAARGKRAEAAHRPRGRRRGARAQVRARVRRVPELPPEVKELAARVRNWGRWGPEDELGTLNLIDAAAVLRGA